MGGGCARCSASGRRFFTDWTPVKSLISSPATPPWRAAFDNPVPSRAPSLERSATRFADAMRRRELELAVRAAARVSRDSEFVLVGSQAVHAYWRRAPAEVLLSQECDLYPKNHPETAGRLDAELGRGSAFARRHGFYVDVVAPEVASLPPGWEGRLRPLRVGSITVLCLELYDLLVSKLAAGRLKDLEFLGALLRLGLAERQLVRRRLRRLPAPRVRQRLRSRLQAVLDDLQSAPAPGLGLELPPE